MFVPTIKVLYCSRRKKCPSLYREEIFSRLPPARQPPCPYWLPASQRLLPLRLQPHRLQRARQPQPAPRLQPARQPQPARQQQRSGHHSLVDLVYGTTGSVSQRSSQITRQKTRTSRSTCSSRRMSPANISRRSWQPRLRMICLRSMAPTCTRLSLARRAWQPIWSPRWGPIS